MNEMSQPTVRRVTSEDVEACMTFAMPLFADHFAHMDWDAVRANALVWVQHPDQVLVVRTEHAVGAAYIGCDPMSIWNPRPETKVFEEFVAADPRYPGEGLAVFQAMAAWAREKGLKFRFNSANGTNVSGIAQRLGAHPVTTYYEVDL